MEREPGGGPPARHPPPRGPLGERVVRHGAHARTAATDIGRVSGNSAVIAASGNPAAKEASWEESDPKNWSSPMSGPTITEPTITYGMASATAQDQMDPPAARPAPEQGAGEGGHAGEPARSLRKRTPTAATSVPMIMCTA